MKAVYFTPSSLRFMPSMPLLMSWTTSSSSMASTLTNSSTPVVERVLMMDWESSAPGTCTRKELEPCCCTLAALAPDALTRVVMTFCASSICSWVTALPSRVEAERLTLTPPWMSRPWVILSWGG